VEIEMSMEMCLTHSMPLILLQFINILETLMEGETSLVIVPSYPSNKFQMEVQYHHVQYQLSQGHDGP
jgi:hypothetical protein